MIPQYASLRRNVRKWFKVTGIYPVNATKALEALRYKEKHRCGFNGPTTPRKLPIVSETIWGTPQGSEDIRK
jgi:4-hydroxybenzoate polyprenyltransferase